MHGPASIAHLTASAGIGTASQPRILFAVVLTAGADAASVTLKSGGSGGTTLLVVKAAAGATAFVAFECGVAFGGGLYAVLTGTTPDVSVSYV